MLYIDDGLVGTLLREGGLGDVLERAFLSWAQDKVAMQPRFRTDTDSFRLVTMGAVIPELGYAGSKVYSSTQGRLSFRILLFSTHSGEALAVLESNTLTKVRTAACSVLAARRYANPQSTELGVFGLGPLGHEHALQFAHAFPIKTIRVCDPNVDASALHALQSQTGADVQHVSAVEATKQSHIIVTATRSLTPVFSGHDLNPGTFVAAIGSCLAHAREIDATTVQRVHKVVVEWPEQTLQDTGDLVLFEDQPALHQKIEALAETLTLSSAQGYDPEKLVMYNAVGIALEDIAAAGLVYELHQQIKP